MARDKKGGATASRKGGIDREDIKSNVEIRKHANAEVPNHQVNVESKKGSVDEKRRGKKKSDNRGIEQDDGMKALPRADEIEGSNSTFSDTKKKKGGKDLPDSDDGHNLSDNAPEGGDPTSRSHHSSVNDNSVPKKKRNSAKKKTGGKDLPDSDDGHNLSDNAPEEGDPTSRSHHSSVNDNSVAKKKRNSAKKKTGGKDLPDWDDGHNLSDNAPEEGDPTSRSHHSSVNDNSVAKKKRNSAKKKTGKNMSVSEDDLDLMRSALKEEQEKKDAISIKKKKRGPPKKKKDVNQSDSDEGFDLMKSALEEQKGKEIDNTTVIVESRSSRGNGGNKNQEKFSFDLSADRDQLHQSSDVTRDEISSQSQVSPSAQKNVKRSMKGTDSHIVGGLTPKASVLSTDAKNLSKRTKKPEDPSESVNEDNHEILDDDGGGPVFSLTKEQDSHGNLVNACANKETMSGNDFNQVDDGGEDIPISPPAGGSAVENSTATTHSKMPRKQSRVLEKRIKKAAAVHAKAAVKKKLQQSQNMDVDDDDIKGPDNDKELRTLLDKAHFGFASSHLPGDFGADPTKSVSTTGILTTPPGKTDVHIKSLTLQAHGKQLITDSELTLNAGRRYGLIAPNGSGKSTLLTALACGMLPLPTTLSVYMLDREYKLSDRTALMSVMDIVLKEQEHLLREEEKYVLKQDQYPEIFNYIQTRIQELESRNTESIARQILSGLGFTEELMNRKTKDLSGGWRMRVSLARVLFAKPMLMLLDEPTNHLDLESVVWLEDFLVNETKGCTILITSHSQDTLNEVCTDIIQIYNKSLLYYTGDYDTFCKVREEREALIKKKAEALKKKMSKIQESLGTSGIRHVQAMQRAKNIQKAKDKSDAQNKIVNEEPEYTKELVLRFEDCGGGLPSPSLKVVDVSFGYSPGDLLFENLNFGIDLSSRIALVGVNGSGKSTLMSLMLSEIKPTSGYVEKHHNLRCARFSQNLADQLDYEKSPVTWLCSHFKEYRDQDMRRFLGRYGLTGKSQVIKIKNLSDGQRRRVLFAYIGLHNPHILFMDEPTNALDIDTIDDLAEAINNFDGGVVMISHDFRLLDQVADSVWIIKDKGVHVYSGEIRDYKNEIKKECERKRLEKEDILKVK